MIKKGVKNHPSLLIFFNTRNLIYNFIKNKNVSYAIKNNH